MPLGVGPPMAALQTRNPAAFPQIFPYFNHYPVHSFLLSFSPLHTLVFILSLLVCEMCFCWILLDVPVTSRVGHILLQVHWNEPHKMTDSDMIIL